METTMTYSNLSAKTLDRAIQSKKFGRYVMLYLYDGFAEMCYTNSVTNKLFTEYGKKINSRLGSDIHLLTVYDKKVIDAWGDDYLGKEKLNRQFSYQESHTSTRNHYKLMWEIAALYGIENFPALILIDTDSYQNGRERIIKTELNGCSAEAIYNHILNTIEAIRDNYGDLDSIFFRWEESKSSLKQKIAENSSLGEIVDWYIHKAHCSQKAVCEQLHISDRTLRRYLKEWEGDKSFPLPRDIAIAMAFILKLTPEEADIMFDAAMVEAVPRLGSAGRDGIIRNCLKNGFDLETTNRELQKNQWLPVSI